jgi:uncharacterized circularly permuted ATP-grasp superfamily protein
MYVPRIIKYYLGRYDFAKCKTYICDEEQDRKYVLENIHNLVVKQTTLLVVTECLLVQNLQKKSNRNLLQKNKQP